MTTVDLTCHLIVSAKVEPRYSDSKDLIVKNRPSVRVSKGKPTTGCDEVAIELKLRLPASLFVKPQLTASLDIPAERHPFVITPEVKESIAESIRQQTGIAVALEVAAPQS